MLAGGDGTDGLFTDEMEMFPGDDGDNVISILGTTREDAQAQQDAAQLAHQMMIDGLVAEGKYLWQAFQAGNNVGSNNNNNSVGGEFFDAAYCTSWMTQRCDTQWMNERASTIQWDSAHINASLASFLIVRAAYTWLGGGRMWNDAFRWDFGLPVSACRNGTAPGVSQCARLPAADVFMRERSLLTAAARPRRRPLSATGRTERRQWTATTTRRPCRATRRIPSVASRRRL